MDLMVTMYLLTIEVSLLETPNYKIVVIIYKFLMIIIEFGVRWAQFFFIFISMKNVLDYDLYPI